MEIKKSYHADLEHRRFGWFLLGLTISVVSLLLVLEVNMSPATYDIDDSMVDELAQELELLPAVDPHEMVMAVPEPATPLVAGNIQVVDELSDVPDMEAANNDAWVDPTGEGEVKGSEVTTALPPVPVTEDNPLNFQVVEELPEFPGGMVEFMKWLHRNLKYPTIAQQQKRQGRVVVQFIVNTDGTITDAKIAKSVDPQLDREALRVVRMMPKWKPGSDHGKPCRTLFAIPVVFKL